MTCNDVEAILGLPQDADITPRGEPPSWSLRWNEGDETVRVFFSPVEDDGESSLVLTARYYTMEKGKRMSFLRKDKEFRHGGWCPPHSPVLGES